MLIREQYNIVQYGDQTFIEGLPAPHVRQVAGGAEQPVKDLEIYDEFRVYDSPPFLTRLGSLT